LVSCLTCAAPGRPPEFLEQCRYYVSRFTDVETEHLIESGPSMTDNLLSLLPQARGEYLAIIEDDDWYAPDYLKWMVGRLGEIEVVGLNPTVYYHLPAAKFVVIDHPGRSSLFTVVGRTEFLRPQLEVACRDLAGNPCVDLRLWPRLGSRAGTVLSGGAIGIKHNWGPCLGQGHNPGRAVPWSRDTDRRWLRRMVGAGDLQFYLRLLDKYAAEEAMEETT
jgi:glycosyltransferase involved in cell wall biosynthesis